MLGVTLIKLTDTDNDVCFVNINKISMILTSPNTEEAIIYLEDDNAISVKMDQDFETLTTLTAYDIEGILAPII